MQNLFYVPPHQPREKHPKPVGVRTVVKRNAPERLDLTTALPSTAWDMGVVTHGDINAEPHLSPVVTRIPPPSWRQHLGRMLVRLGHLIEGNHVSPQGQPA